MKQAADPCCALGGGATADPLLNGGGYCAPTLCTGGDLLLRAPSTSAPLPHAGVLRRAPDNKNRFNDGFTEGSQDIMALVRVSPKSMF